MLIELSVTNLGIIETSGVGLGAGLTAITGETGAGKTLLVEALELLLGARADAGLVRDGAEEARVDGRFLRSPGDTEVVLSRVIPGTGRSRAYVDGHPATVAELAERGAELVDLHSQRSQQRLLESTGARAALDAFGGPELAEARTRHREAFGRRRTLRVELDALGGDERVRARELDLLQYQIDEIAAVGIEDADEEVRLAQEADVLADAEAHRAAVAAAHTALVSARDGVGRAVEEFAGRPFPTISSRFDSLTAELDDLVAETRSLDESIVVDPERLEAVQQRRARLAEIRRKYGETLTGVLEFAGEIAARREALEAQGTRAGQLAVAVDEADATLAETTATLHDLRTAAAARLTSAVNAVLPDLAMPGARICVTVTSGPCGEDGGDDVAFLLAANEGEAPRPLAKAVSGGELSRIMLALRLVLPSVTGRDVPTVVFDEVDAGIGGEAGVAVGRALAAVGRDHQVLCVTHLASVAAFADHQWSVSKERRGTRTVSSVELLLDEETRTRELSRMLAGVETSEHARMHAAELLAEAGRERATVRP